MYKLCFIYNKYLTLFYSMEDVDMTMGTFSRHLHH